MVCHSTAILKINMNIGRDEKIHIARYLSFLLSAEKVAHRCAARQAKLCSNQQIKSFLIKQSRQERFHAVTFRSALLWLAPRGVTNPAKKQMRQYESILLNATDNHDLLSSIVGLQVILEGMGDVALSRFDHGIEQRGLGYQKIRHAILAQEDTHHEFGLNYLNEQKLSATTVSYTENYLSLINDTLSSLQGQFDFFEEHASCYFKEFNRKLPERLQKYALDYHPNT